MISTKNKSIARLSLEAALASAIRGKRLGRVLDVGAKNQPYRSIAEDIQSYTSLDVCTNEQSPVDIVGDIHDLDLPGAQFDTVIMTEVLEHCYDPEKAVQNVHRLLAPGGQCILSTRFFHPYHPDPDDYFRFTASGLTSLFKDFASVEVKPLGNRVQTLWLVLIHGRQARLARLVSRLTPTVFRMFPRSDAVWACGFLVVAKKGE